MTSVLEGISVIDLSQGIAGPIAGMLLSDHGAAVTKIEPPGGDRFRSLPGSNAWLRGRRSIELDLAKHEDQATFHALVGSADVVLESFAPGTAEQLGADPTTLLELNPGLVHCSITGYGAHPAHRHRPAYDALVAARLGILGENRGHLGGPTRYINGDDPFLPDLEIPEGMAPGSPRPGPIFNHTPWPSLCAAYLATMGINAALLARERDGRGQHVETSLLQAALALTTGKWQKAENHRAAGYPTWIYDQRASKGFFECSDGRWIEIWVPNPRFVLSSAAGDTLEVRSHLASARDDDERIPPDEENIIVLAHYWPAMKEAFAKFPSDEWVRVAAEAGVPLQLVRTPEEALADPALLAEGAVVDIDHPDHGRLRQIGVVYGMSATPGAVQGPVPRVGEHNEVVRAEAAALRSGPVSPPPSAATGRPPLDGVTVLDLGFAVAGPFGTQALADLGANVIKINATRDPLWHATHIAYGCNRGKRSICIDLKNPDGLAVLHRLVAAADVVHSNMRRDALVRLGCDEASLRLVNPDAHLLPHPRLRPGAAIRLARERPDRRVARRGHLGGRRLLRRRTAVLEPHLDGRHRQRLPLRHRRHPSALPPGPDRRGAKCRHFDHQRRAPVGVDRLGDRGRDTPAPPTPGPAPAWAHRPLPALRNRRWMGLPGGHRRAPMAGAGHGPSRRSAWPPTNASGRPERPTRPMTSSSPRFSNTCSEDQVGRRMVRPAR